LTIGVRRADAVRAECVRHLRGLAGWNTPALGVEPARELAPAGHAVVRSDGRVGVAPFLVAEGALGGADAGLALDAPTTLDNAVRVLRAMQVGRPLLLEGSPGVGKTALVGALARLAGQRLVRINLSDQTDLMDLFGTDLPSGDGFAWCDAPFLQALQRGDWVLLDEINLASQSVLEGLNSCLDHRGTVYIAELDREFALAPGFRLFAAQNPLGQGGGRKGLPRSFVNRFTQVHVSELRRDDLQIICDRLYGGGPSSAQVLEFNRRMHDATMGARAFGAAGAPWEFNLRDVSRLMQVVLSPSPLGVGPRPVDGAVRMLYEHRMRTGRDRQQVRSLFHDVFGRPMAHAAPTLHASEDWLQVGDAVLPRRAGSVLAGRLRSLRGRLAGLESLAKCVEMQWMAILVGAAGAGKTALVRWLAATTGNKLVEVAMNSGVDTSEILGGFEQVDAQRHRSRLLARARATVDRLIGRAGCSSSDAALATHASALYEQALACEDRQQLRVLVGELAEHAGDAELDAAAAALAQLQSAGRFEWVDGILVEALERGWWLLIDRANLCSAAVLDRLNGLLEPGGVLHVNEDPARAEPVAPHPDFRIFMAVDPQYGELSRAMRNRGVEICLLPDADDGASVTEAAGLPRALLRASSPSSSLAEAAQLAAQAAERVQRGGAVQAESCDAGRELCPLEPRSRDVTVAVAGWQAQLVAAAAGESSGVRRERMLLAALGAVAPRPHAPETHLLSAIIGERPLAARLLASTLDEPIMRARQALAQVSGVHDDVLAAAPACLALNGGLTQALARHAGDPAWKWHATLLDALRFWRERAAAEELCPTDDAGMREQ
ncbi:AAA ATPase midasin, partial [Coemansia biformis]